jgi:uncharacterized protein (TIGR04255 family)
MPPSRSTVGECLTDDKSMARLPEYKNPPVVETALAIEFAPLPGWNLLYFGSLWEKFREAYPKTELTPAIPSTDELDITKPPVRFFLKNEDETQLLQLRDGAFVRNWRSRPENEQYPRYDAIRPSFERDLRVFFDFVSANGFPFPEVWKCEVTYVNHFLRGREWSDTSRLCQMLPALSDAKLSPLLSNLTRLAFAFNYELPGDVGNLQIQMAPGLRADGKELLQLTLTAYGKPLGSEIHQLMDWLDKGHVAVVQGFTDFTSREVQTEEWGRLWL